MQQDRSTRKKGISLLKTPGATEEAAYSPYSNPFAARPDTRTPTGSFIAMKLSPKADAADSPEITTSADGAYYDIDLSPGTSSKPKGATRLQTEAITNPCYEPDADSWLSSPDVDMEGIKQSWDSAGKLRLPAEDGEPEPTAASPADSTPKLPSRGNPLTGDKGGNSVKAKAWLRGQAKSPGRAALPSTEDSEVPLEDQWKIPAATAMGSLAKPAGSGPRSTISEFTPRRDPKQAASPLVVPSPAHEYPRSFPLLAEEPAISCLPSATGSFRAWLSEDEGALQDTGNTVLNEEDEAGVRESPTAESVQAVEEQGLEKAELEGEDEAEQEVVQDAAQHLQQEERVEKKEQQQEERVEKKAKEQEEVLATPALAAEACSPAAADAGPAAFASPISLAAESPATIATPRARLSFGGAASPPSTRPSAATSGPRSKLGISTVACALAFVATLAAAVLLVPAGFSMAAPAGIGVAANVAIFPAGGAVPQLGPQLTDWARGRVAGALPPALAQRAPAWLLPPKQAAPLRQTLRGRLAGWAQARLAQLPPQLREGWAPAWLRQPAEPASAPASIVRPTIEAMRPVAQASAVPKGKPAGSLGLHVLRSIKWPPPLPKSWAKPLPPLNSGTEHLKPPPSELAKLAKMAEEAAAAALPEPATPSEQAGPPTPATAADPQPATPSDQAEQADSTPAVPPAADPQPAEQANPMPAAATLPQPSSPIMQSDDTPAAAAASQPAFPSSPQPQPPALPVVQPAEEAAPPVAPPKAVLPVAEPPRVSNLPSPPPPFVNPASAAPEAPAMPQLPPAPVESPGFANRLAAAVHEQAAGPLSRLQHWAEGPGLQDRAQAVLSHLPPLPTPLAGYLAGVNSQVLAAIGAASMAAAVLGGAVAVTALVGRGARGSAAPAAKHSADDGEVAEREAAARELADEGRGLQEEGQMYDSRPGVKSGLFSHMRVQRQPTTTPAIGGRARRRQSYAIATIEEQPDDDGIPSVAPNKPALRSAAKSRARQQVDPAAAGAPAPTPRTATRSARREASVPEEMATDTPGLRRSRRLAL